MTEYSQMPGTSKSTHELLIKIPGNLETTLSDILCIYKVPPSLRQINPSAYTPQVISIGPIHHDNKLLKKMEIQKLRYFHDFCKRTLAETREDQERIQQEFATELLNQIDEDEIRHYYAHDSYSEIGSTELVNLILLDSVFIIELFLKSIKFSAHKNDFIMGKPWLRTDVQNDLILLENQIPFQILEKIYNFAMNTIADTPCNYPPFLDLTCNYFNNIKPKNPSIKNPETILHFTDLVRHFWACKCPEMCKSGTIDNLYSITKLHQAGLKLRAAKGKCFLDIKYSPGISCVKFAELEIPCFEVDDTTEFVVRNLMALEQCHYPDETYICNYIRLLDLLIDTAEDVDLLVDKKIIVNGLGHGRAVADLVNNLCNQIVEVKSCYSVLAIKLNRFYESCGNHTMATLRSVYFGDLWRGTGTIAAVVLLILTLIQTVCSIIQL